MECVFKKTIILIGALPYGESKFYKDFRGVCLAIFHNLSNLFALVCEDINFEGWVKGHISGWHFTLAQHVFRLVSVCKC